MIIFSSLSFKSILIIYNDEFLLQNMFKEKLKTSIKIFRRDVKIFLQKSMNQFLSFRICT